MRIVWTFAAALLLAVRLDAQPFEGTAPLTAEGDLARAMLEGIDTFLGRTGRSLADQRAAHWHRDFTSPEKYAASVSENRAHLRTIIGAVDVRDPAEMRFDAAADRPALVARGPGYQVFHVRWPVFRGVTGEGLLLEPDTAPKASVVALPDCDWTPEMICGLQPGVPPEAQYARWLAANGCRVLVPLLIDRGCEYAGNPKIRMTNQTHREFILRAAFHLGRHIIGYEVGKVQAAVDWFTARGPEPVGVIGYGEGGLIALYAAAVDERIDAAVVSGYFGPREMLCTEPLYRSVWALLTEFGDAEIASLIAPRALTIEAVDAPKISGPPFVEGLRGGAPGVILTLPPRYAEAELRRAADLVGDLKPAPDWHFFGFQSNLPGMSETLYAFLSSLGATLATMGGTPEDLGVPFDAEARRKRQFDELVEDTQRLMRDAAAQRTDYWAKADASTPEAWQGSTAPYRAALWEEIIGKLPPATEPMNPRSRLILDEPAYRGYEVVLDVYPDVFAYGILLLPKDLAPGEKRPVVVCQHGLEGRPNDLADPRVTDPAYNQYGCRLAERGYIVFAPQNPYIFGDDFRQLQRRAHPLKLSLFSFIIRQHERILEWIATLPGVDPDRIGFYGISYGGKTALRVPALLPQYKVVVCSGDFNEWIWKVASVDAPFGYMLTHEYEMLEFNLGNTFNHAEMSWLIFPRPFMVERGHDDGVSIDEWVAYEYARTRRLYDKLGLGDRTEIEFFNGPHCIHAVGTFAFLDKHLGWTPKTGQ